MGRNNTLENNLGCSQITCEYTEKINKAAARGNKAMFQAKDIRRAKREMENEQEQGFGLGD